MKTKIFITLLIALSLNSLGQLDSVAFIKKSNAQVKSLGAIKFKIDNAEISTEGAAAKYISFDTKCNFVAPKYSQLGGAGAFAFRQIKGDVSGSLNALGSTLTFERKCQYYSFFFVRSKKFTCENNPSLTVSYGIAVYVIFKLTNVNSAVNIKTPYDISAAAQLNLAKVEMDVRTIGMLPDLQNEFIPDSLSDISVKTAGYFDKLPTIVKTKVNDSNTDPDILPFVAW